MKRILYIIPSLLLALSSCSTQKSAYSVGGEWALINLNGKSITPSSETPFIGIDLSEGHLYGFTGCNRLTGNINVKAFPAGKPNFSQLGMTRMLCPDDVYESDFMEALNKVKSSEVKNNEMLLKDAKGNVSLTFKKK